MEKLHRTRHNVKARTESASSPRHGAHHQRRKNVLLSSISRPFFNVFFPLSHPPAPPSLSFQPLFSAFHHLFNGLAFMPRFSGSAVRYQDTPLSRIPRRATALCYWSAVHLLSFCCSVRFCSTPVTPSHCLCCFTSPHCTIPCICSLNAKRHSFFTSRFRLLFGSCSARSFDSLINPVVDSMAQSPSNIIRCLSCTFLAQGMLSYYYRHTCCITPPYLFVHRTYLFFLC